MTPGIAIRLACPARGVRLDRSAVLARHRASAPQTATVVAQYWDTASMALQRRAMALALLARDGGPVVQTLEIESSFPLTAQSFTSPGGASAPGFAFALAQGFEPDESLSAQERDLRPMFTIRIERTWRTVAFRDGTRVALAIDRGTMQAGAGPGRGRGTRRRFREIAIVLLEGDARRVCDLARELVGEQPGLRLEFASLAQRGYRLVTGSTAAGGRPRRTPPQRRASGAQVAIAGLRDALSQFAANAAGAASDADPEYVHRMRAALRRLRVADRLAGAAGLPVFPRRLVGDIRWLSGVLAAARDWDVVQTQTWPAIRNDARGMRGIDVVSARIAVERARRHRDLRVALRSARFQRLMLELLRTLLPSFESHAPARSVRRRDAKSFARRVLAPLLADVAKADRRLGEHALPERQHALRIVARKLRYGAELFADGDARRPVSRYLRRLADLQSVLGDLNDLRVSGRLIARAAGAHLPAAHAIARSLVARRLALARRLQRTRKRFRSTVAFWD
ncbi:MAG: CHAD domain-containing protein [Betaproteobacteria bacterium]|nr:CHAD domain-containing protein [Betaproteobacteria bacterium]